MMFEFCFFDLSFSSILFEIELHWQENQFFLANTVSQNIFVDNLAS